MINLTTLASNATKSCGSRNISYTDCMLTWHASPAGEKCEFVLTAPKKNEQLNICQSHVSCPFELKVGKNMYKLIYKGEINYCPGAKVNFYKGPQTSEGRIVEIRCDNRVANSKTKVFCP